MVGDILCCHQGNMILSHAASITYQVMSVKSVKIQGLGFTGDTEVNVFQWCLPHSQFSTPDSLRRYGSGDTVYVVQAKLPLGAAKLYTVPPLETLLPYSGITEMGLLEYLQCC